MQNISTLQAKKAGKKEKEKIHKSSFKNTLKAAESPVVKSFIWGFTGADSVKPEGTREGLQDDKFSEFLSVNYKRYQRDLYLSPTEANSHLTQSFTVLTLLHMPLSFISRFLSVLFSLFILIPPTRYHSAVS